MAPPDESEPLNLDADAEGYDYIEYQSMVDVHATPLEVEIAQKKDSLETLQRRLAILAGRDKDDAIDHIAELKDDIATRRNTKVVVGAALAGTLLVAGVIAALLSQGGSSSRTETGPSGAAANRRVVREQHAKAR